MQKQTKSPIRAAFQQHHREAARHAGHVPARRANKPHQRQVALGYEPAHQDWEENLHLELRPDDLKTPERTRATIFTLHGVKILTRSLWA